VNCSPSALLPKVDKVFWFNRISGIPENLQKSHRRGHPLASRICSKRIANANGD
jgi:hypothetical protein